MEYTGLSRYVWHLPLFFVGLVVLFSPDPLASPPLQSALPNLP
jgi:hypothetical protein